MSFAAPGWIPNPSGAFGYAPTSSPVVSAHVPPPVGQAFTLTGSGSTGIQTPDAYAIQSALSGEGPLFGGAAQLMPGTYVVNSYARTDTGVTTSPFITAATNSGTLITATIPSTVGLAPGQPINVLQASGGTWNNIIGSWTILRVVNSTQFQFVVTNAPTGSYTASSATVNTCFAADTNANSADLGRYLIAPAWSNQTPQIVSVINGVGFVLDNCANPISTGVLNMTCYVVAPGIVQPEGTWCKGYGGIVGLGRGNYFSNTANAGPAKFGTRILDLGDGITWMTRGSNSYGSRYGLSDMTMYGGNTALGNARGGLYIGNNSWWMRAWDLDFQYYTDWGGAADGNMNMYDIRNCSFQNIAFDGNTRVTGGFLAGLLCTQVSSSVCFDNCLWFNIHGMGLGSWFNQPFGSVGAIACQLRGGQIANVFQNSSSPASTYGGYGAVFQSTGAGACLIDGTWMGTNGNGDVWLNAGALTCINATLSSALSPVVTSYGALCLDSVHFTGTSHGGLSPLVANNGSINWRNVDCDGSTLYAGGPTAAQALGMGTSIVGGLWSGAGVVTQP